MKGRGYHELFYSQSALEFWVWFITCHSMSMDQRQDWRSQERILVYLLCCTESHGNGSSCFLSRGTVTCLLDV